MSETSPIVKIRNVSKVFQTDNGPFHALRDVSFDVMPGDVVSIIGPSGSGKTTCLRIVNALETINSGEVEVCGIKYAEKGTPPFRIRRNTAMIFQRFELFPHMKAIDNVAMGPKYIHGKSQEESRAIALKLLERFDIAAQAEKYPRALSGGQQQRVAIARALALQPKVLLCDEPTSALDPELVDEILDILVEIARTGMTMLIVTHEMRFARDVSTRVLFFDEGIIKEQGATAQVFSNPENARLKLFLKQLHV
jgi:ABC-type polar amino acid transport system ATPase subunit